MTPVHPRSIAAATLGMAASLLLAACGSSTAPSASAHASTGNGGSGGSTTGATPPAVPAAAQAAGSAADACALVTEHEVGAAIGADPGAGKAFASHGSSQCQYGSYQSGFVLVNLTPSRGRAGYDLMHNNPKLGQTINVADIAGIGDRAFEVTGPNSASIYFDKGDALILVTVEIPTATAAPKSQALALAKAAVGRA
jgi:hypothetical protein